MNFCPACDFMVYTKQSSDKSKLINYCKNCEWEGDYQSDKKSICVYKQSYSNDFLAQQAITSKYTVDDPTLPRISNIKCINDSCLTNINFNDTTIHLTDAKSIIEHEDSDVLKKFYIENGTLETDFESLNINDSEIVTKFNKKADYDKYTSSFNTKITIKDSIEVFINKYTPPSREIIFIKYDPINLKYLYLCSTCKTTWKSN